jgi:hypothetical protein
MPKVVISQYVTRCATCGHQLVVHKVCILKTKCFNSTCSCDNPTILVEFTEDTITISPVDDPDWDL